MKEIAGRRRKGIIESIHVHGAIPPCSHTEGHNWMKSGFSGDISCDLCKYHLLRLQTPGYNSHYFLVLERVAIEIRK